MVARSRSCPSLLLLTTPIYTGCSTTTTCAAGLLENLARGKGVTLPDRLPAFDPNYEFDRLAVHVRRHLDMDLVYRVMEDRRPVPGPAPADRSKF